MLKFIPQLYYNQCTFSNSAHHLSFLPLQATFNDPPNLVICQVSQSAYRKYITILIYNYFIRRLAQFQERRIRDRFSKQFALLD
jgi:hypothetical protein